jgi:hypothetical protein
VEGIPKKEERDCHLNGIVRDEPGEDESRDVQSREEAGRTQDKWSVIAVEHGEKRTIAREDPD